MRTGIDGMTFNLAINGHRTERISLLGEIAAKAIMEANGSTAEECRYQRESGALQASSKTKRLRR